MKITIDIDDEKVGNLTTQEVFYLAGLVADDAYYHPTAILNKSSLVPVRIGTLSIETEEQN